MISIAFALVLASVSFAQTETPTPTPGVERFADFDADKVVAPHDLLMMIRAWYQSELDIPAGSRGRVADFYVSTTVAVTARELVAGFGSS